MSAEIATRLEMRGAVLSSDAAAARHTPAQSLESTPAVHPPSSSCCEPTPAETATGNSGGLRHLKLGDKTVVSFTVDSIPDPVAVSFVHNIPRLNSMWDDTSHHWGQESVLTIKGHPIPIVYWPDIYRYGKTRQWKGTKSSWADWRVGFHQTAVHTWLMFSAGYYCSVPSELPRKFLGGVLCWWEKDEFHCHCRNVAQPAQNQQASHCGSCPPGVWRRI